MQDDNAKRITYGALMIGLFALLLAVSVYVPVIGVLAMLFIPLPMILYRIRYDRSASLFVVGTGIILSVFIGGPLLVPFALVYGLLGFVIGDTIKTEKSKLYTFMASGLTLLTLTILIYVAAVLFFNFNFIEIVMDTVRASQEQATSLLMKSGELPENFKEQMNASISYTETAIPSIYIIGTFGMAFAFVSLNLLAMKKLGHSNLKSFPPFREMKLPLITVWYYLIVLIAGLFFEIQEGTGASLVYINASIVLRFLFFLQGISFIHFFMNKKKLPKWVTVISTIIAVPLSPITVLLGVLDAGLNVRAWIGKEKAK